MKQHIKVIPSSSKGCIAGWLEEHLKVKVNAPSDKGRANKAVIKVLEKSLNLAKGSVSIVHGLTSCKKIVEIVNCDENIIRQQLKEYSL